MMKYIETLCLCVAVAVTFSACENGQSLQSQPQTSVYTQTEAQIEYTDVMTLKTEKNEEKILIAYFSMADSVPEDADAVTHATSSVGNTELAAMEICNIIGGDVFAIKTVQTYPTYHRECSEIAEEELRSDARPEISEHLDNMNDYDIVFVGYPIWWYQEPMAIRTFLEEYDFSGKKIIPFCTTLGAGIEESEKNIKDICPDSTILDGLTLYSGRSGYSESIEQWLKEIEIIN